MRYDKVSTNLIKTVIIVHGELVGVLELPDPVEEDGVTVADAERHVPGKLGGVLHQKQSVRAGTEDLLNLQNINRH